MNNHFTDKEIYTLYAVVYITTFIFLYALAYAIFKTYFYLKEKSMRKKPLRLRWKKIKRKDRYPMIEVIYKDKKEPPLDANFAEALFNEMLVTSEERVRRN